MIKGTSVGLLLLGFVVGGISIGAVIAWRYSILFRDQHYGELIGIVNTATMVRAGRSDQLVEMSESSIRQGVATADSIWKDHDQRLNAFWNAKAYYQRFKLDIPNELQPIFEALPPRPPTSCEIGRLADSNQLHEIEQLAAENSASGTSEP